MSSVERLNEWQMEGVALGSKDGGIATTLVPEDCPNRVRRVGILGRAG